MPETKISDRPPIIGVLQVKSLVALMDKFYGDPKNMAAYEKWEAEQERQKRRRGVTVE